MRNFQLIAAGLDVFPIEHALACQPGLWNQNNLRTAYEGTPHAQADDIWLRFQDLEPYKQSADAAKVVDEHESMFYDAWRRLPEAQNLVFDLMRRVRGTRLGRVLITRLAPGSVIDPHEDGGTHAEYFERYHILIKCQPGAVFHCGGESVQMRTGECWWFENSLEHSVVNNSADDRITMIVDIRVEH